MKNLLNKKPLLVGIFIGLTFGLCIAILVALIVTKTVSKVSSKYQAQEKIAERDPSEQPPDPNKPLYAQTSSDGAISRKTEEKPSVKTDKSDQGEEKEEKVRREWRYYLQAGAYLNKEEAENVRAQLAFMGLEANLSQKWSSQGTLHRVRTGPFPDAELMNQVRRRLIQSGFQPSVIRLQVKEEDKKP